MWWRMLVAVAAFFAGCVNLLLMVACAMNEDYMLAMTFLGGTIMCGGSILLLIKERQ